MFQNLSVSADEPPAQELPAPRPLAKTVAAPAVIHNIQSSVGGEEGKASMASSLEDEASELSAHRRDPPWPAGQKCTAASGSPFPSVDDGGGGDSVRMIRFAQNVGGSRRFLVSRSGHVFVARGTSVTSLVSTSLSSFIKQLLT